MRTKKHFKLLLAALLIIGYSQQTKAQFWKKFTKKVEKKIERKVENKLDRETDKTIDKTINGEIISKKEDNKGKKKKSANKGQVLNFNQSIMLEVTSSENDTMELQYFFNNKEKEISCMKIDPSKVKGGNNVGGDIYMVFNKDSGALYMNMVGMKIKKEIGAAEMNKYDNSNKMDAIDIVKTGKTKNILGYSCNEYVAKKEDATTHIWATTSSFPIKGSFIPVLGMKNQNQKIKGFVLEIVMHSKKGNGKVTVTKINPKSNLTINTGEYSSMFNN